MNIPPNYLIGDLDSANPKDIHWAHENKTTIITYPREKDEIDTELALMYVKEKNEKDVVISCVFETNRSRNCIYIPLAEYIELNPVILEENVKVELLIKKNWRSNTGEHGHNKIGNLLRITLEGLNIP